MEPEQEQTNNFSFDFLDSCHSLKIPLPFIKLLGVQTATVLFNLVDKMRQKSDGEWLFCPNRIQRDELGISESRLVSCKSELKNRGLMEVEMRGFPPQEFYMVNSKRMAQILHSFESRPTKINVTPNNILSSKEDNTIIENNPVTGKGIKDISAKAEKSWSSAVVEQQHIRNFPITTWKGSALKLWNDLEGPTTHKKLNTKTLQNVNTILDQIHDGTFFHYNTISEEFCKKHRIPRDRYMKKKVSFTPEMIKDAIRKFGFCWNKQSWPFDKRVLPKTFDLFLHNSFTGVSWFLMIHFNPGVLNNSVLNYESPYRVLFNWYLKDRGKTHGYINRMIDHLGYWVLENFDMTDIRVKHHFLNEALQTKTILWPFFSKYARWLRDKATELWKEEWLWNNPRQLFESWGQVFNEYLTFLEDTEFLCPKER